MAEWGGPHAVTNLVSLVAVGKRFSDVYRQPSGMSPAKISQMRGRTWPTWKTNSA
jgi:hypothetical protein